MQDFLNKNPPISVAVAAQLFKYTLFIRLAILIEFMILQVISNLVNSKTPQIWTWLIKKRVNHNVIISSLWLNMLTLESDLKLVYKSQFCLTISHLVARTVGNSNFQTTLLKILSKMKLVWALSIVLVCAFISQASEDQANIWDASFFIHFNNVSFHTHTD